MGGTKRQTEKRTKMKSTQERLKSSYCVPRGAEWDAFGLIPLSGHKVMWLGGEPTLVSGEFTDRAEITVSQFIDLLKDSIVPWRLEGDGFRTTTWKCTTAYEIDFVGKRSLTVIDGAVTVWNDEDDSISKGVPMIGITTYTDLLTLIRIIG